jgi:hypothetical protein
MRAMIAGPRLIIQLPRDGALHLQLAADPPQSVADGEVVVDPGPTDVHGHLEISGTGDVVRSVASPETLAREADELKRTIRGAGTGDEPLVVVVEAAEELREDELAPVLEAAGHTPRAVILRIMGDG